MIRAVFVMSLCAFAPMTPACAVVAIGAPARIMPVATPEQKAPASVVSQSSGPDFGEVAAALIGFGILGITAFGSRQPHSVTS